MFAVFLTILNLLNLYTINILSGPEEDTEVRNAIDIIALRNHESTLLNSVNNKMSDKAQYYTALH